MDEVMQLADDSHELQTRPDFTETGPYFTEKHETVISPTIRASDTNVADAQFDKAARLITLYVQIVLGVIGGLLVCAWLWANRQVQRKAFGFL